MYIGAPVHELCLIIICAAVVYLLSFKRHDPALFGSSDLIAQTERMPLGALQERILS